MQELWAAVNHYKMQAVLYQAIDRLVELSSGSRVRDGISCVLQCTVVPRSLPPMVFCFTCLYPRKPGSSGFEDPKHPRSHILFGLLICI